MLDALRQQIDDLDRELVELIERRAQIACQIGIIKKQQSLPYYVPTREAHTLRWVQLCNKGNILTSEQLIKIYEQIMRACLEVQDSEQRDSSLLP